jgi:hypothetical protein
MLEKPSTKVGLRTMREEIAVLAGPRDWGDTRESWLARAADKLQNVPYRMVKSFFYGEIIDENHWAAREIRRAAKLAKARQEATAIEVQYQTIIEGLNARDPDFHREDIAALISVLRQMRGENRT